MVMYMSTTATLGQLADMVDRFTPDERLPHDPYVLVALEEALAAASDGNFGVGACLVDPRGQVVACGHNRVFHPYPRSDLHAEMDTMTRFETQHPDIMSLRQYTLFTSLEPCPMCLTRLITAGVGHVYYAVPDPEGGMVCKLHDLTPVWVELARRQEFAEARISPQLAQIAQQIFLITANDATARLSQR